MYSPAARPSRQRAAPAKKRRLSAITGISSLRHRRDRLARVQRLQARELLAVLLDQRRPARAAPASAARASSATSRRTRRARGLHRAVDVLGARDRRARQLLAGGRVEDRLRSRRCGGDRSPSMKLLQRRLSCSPSHCLLGQVARASQCAATASREHARAARPAPRATAGWVISPRAHVQAHAQARVALQGALDAVLGQRDHVRQRRVRERVGRGDRHRARHVRDAVVGDPVDLEGRVGVGGRARGLKAATLIDRHVHQHRVRFISPSCSRVTTCGARPPWTSTAPITRSASGSISSIASVEEYTVEARPPNATSSSRSRSIERSNTNTSACMPIAMKAAFIPTTPPPITSTVAAATPGTPPSRMPAPAERLLQHEGAGLRGDLAGHLAHRRQQRQPPLVVLDRLIGDARRARLLQPARQLGLGRQMQVGEERLALAQHPDLGGLGLLHLQHQLGLARTPPRRRGRSARPAPGTARRSSRCPRPRPPASAPRARARSARCTPAGVIATRYSSALTSVGTPISSLHLLAWTVHATLAREPRQLAPHRASSRPRSASQNSMRSRALEKSRPVSCSTRRMR